MGAAAAVELLEGDKLIGPLLLVFLVGSALLASFQLRLHFGEGRAIESAACEATMLKRAAVKTRAVVVVSLTNDLAAAHDDTAMAVVEGRFGGLLEAKSEVIVRLHFVNRGGVSGERAIDGWEVRFAGVEYRSETVEVLEGPRVMSDRQLSIVGFFALFERTNRRLVAASKIQTAACASGGTDRIAWKVCRGGRHAYTCFPV